MNDFLKVGHRGACGYEPENTLRSFKRAIEMGVDMVECDVYCCKSGEPVVIHDSTVDRTTNGHGLVHDLTLSELKKLSIENSETIPTLQEVIDLCRNKVQINIEIKDSDDALAALDVVRQNHAYSWTMISSNFAEPLKQARAADSQLTTALIFYSTKTNVRDILFALICLLVLPFTLYIIKKRAKKSGAQWVNIMQQLANRYVISTLRGHGYKVGVWTVDKPNKIKKIVSLGAEAIISNFPDRL